MNVRVTRRAALVSSVTAAAGLFYSPSSAAPVPKGDGNKSWVGKTVLPKKPDRRADLANRDPEAVVPDGAFLVVRGASWEVKAEKGTRVQVVENGILFWVEKDALVPLADATE